MEMNNPHRNVLFIALAAGVTLAALLAAGDAGGAVSPFAWWTVVAAHTLATLPLAWMCAKQLAQQVPAACGRRTVSLWVAAGVVLAYLTVAHGSWIGDRLDGNAAEGGPRALVRVLWCLVLPLPWMMLGQGDVGQQPPPASLLRQFGLLAAALAVAVVVPAVYVDHQVDNRIVKQLNEELLHRQFVVRAMNLLDELCELGITEPSIHPLRLLKSESTEKVVFGRKDRVAPRYARDLLKQVEAHFREQVALREQRKPTKKDRLELAFLYFWLDQMQPAIDVLGELPRQDPRAARLLANIYQQQRQHDDSIAAFRRMIELLNVETGESDTRAKAEAYAGVANGYQALRQFDDAEAVYLEALVEVPGEAAFLRFHLGLHYQWVGRPLEARRQLETAADLDPDRFRGQVAAIFRNEMTELSPGCMLGPLR